MNPVQLPCPHCDETVPHHCKVLARQAEHRYRVYADTISAIDEIRGRLSELERAAREIRDEPHDTEPVKVSGIYGAETVHAPDPISSLADRYKRSSGTP